MKKKYSYKTLIVNFKSQHQDLYEWIKKYCDEQGVSISHTIRELIKSFKEEQSE